MKTKHTCPKCHSNDVIANVRPLDLSDSGERTAQLAIYRNPAAFLFKGRQSTAMSAWVCAECGFVEFYADEPKMLKLAGG